MFINDILNGCEGNGLVLPGILEEIRGLLFADDLVLMAPTLEKLRASIEAAQAWAEQWEMSFGVAKCGIMVVGGSDEDEEELEERLFPWWNHTPT